MIRTARFLSHHHGGSPQTFVPGGGGSLVININVITSCIRNSNKNIISNVSTLLVFVKPPLIKSLTLNITIACIIKRMINKLKTLFFTPT